MADLAKIQFKRTSTSGKTPTGLSAGELAMNIKDGRLFSSDGTNLIEFGLSKGGTIDGNLTINGNITTSGGGELAAADGNLYLNKSGATGWIDALFLRKDISNTMNGSFTATGSVTSNSGTFYSNDSNHYLNLGVSGTNNANWGNYGGTFNFLNTNGKANVLSLSPGAANFSNGQASVSLGKILFNPSSTAGSGSNSNNDYSRGVGFNIESVDTSNSNYPSSMGTLMTSVLSSLRVFQLYSSSGSGQGLYFRDMRNDGSGNVAWNQLYSTANKPGASDVGAYTTAQSDSLFAPKANFMLSGTDAHMQGTGSSYMFMNASGTSGVYNTSSRAVSWGFDNNGKMTSGLIPVSNGGTGATNASDARSNLGLGNGAEIVYTLPGASSGKMSWMFLGNVKNAGTQSAKVQLIIEGGGNYGNGLSEINYLDITGRFSTNGNGLLPLLHRRSAGGTNDITFGYVANTTTSGSTTTINSYDIYMKDHSGWFNGAQVVITSSSNLAGYFSGGITNGNFSSWTNTEPTNIVYAEPVSLAANYTGETVQINGEFVSSNSNGLRIANDSTTTSSSTLLRTDGTNFNILISNSGVATGNNWNTLRPFEISLSSGLVTMGNGLLINGGDLTVNSGNIYTNDSGHYIKFGNKGNNVSNWGGYNGLFQFENTNGNVIQTTFSNGDISTIGSITASSDNSMFLLGKNGDLGLIKKSGASGRIGISNNNGFIVSQSSNNYISPSDTFTDIMRVDGSSIHGYNNLQIDGSSTLSGAVNINSALTVKSSSNITGQLTVGGRGIFNDGVTINNGFSVNSATSINNTLNVSGVLTTSTYAMFGSYGNNNFIPSTQGSYIGWNFPSGQGNTVFINHRGTGPGGFIFYNSDGKTNTQLASLDNSGALRLTGGLAATGITASNGLTVSSGDLNVTTGNVYVPHGIIYGKDGNHSIDMRADSYTFNTYNGQFYFTNTNGGAQAELSYSGNIKGSQWGNAWLSDYMNSTYANVTGQTFTGAVNFANNTWNKFGDDVQIGDRNIAGKIAIGAQNATSTGIGFFISSNTSTTPSASITVTAGAISLDNATTVKGNLTGTGTGIFSSYVNAAGFTSSNGLTVSNGTTSVQVLNVAGMANIQGMTANGYVTLQKGTTANNGLTVNGSATINDGFKSTGNATFNADVTTTNNITVGSATYQTDGNVKGSVWSNGYLSDFINRIQVAGGVGSLATMVNNSSNTHNLGDDISGSDLQFASVGANYDGGGNFAKINRDTSTVPSGTWRCMGYSSGRYSTGANVCLYIRIA